MNRARNMRLGLAGLGVASTLAMPEIARHPHVEIGAGADPRSVARQAFAAEFRVPTYDSIEAMCANPDLDAIHILTPNRLHAEHAIVAAEHGKQVILDKPLARSLAEAERVIAAVARNGVRLIVGHTQSLDAPIRKMAEIVASGVLGLPRTINTLFFSDWLYRPRSLEELDPAPGEGLLMRQGPVQADIVRMLGGGLVRSVRATTSAGDPARPINGGYAAFVEFENGAAATMTYSGYGFFDSTELTYGVGLQGYPADPATNRRSHALIDSFADRTAEYAFKEASRYGNARPVPAAERPNQPERRHAFFGFTLVSCERGDIRQTPTGVAIYTARGREDVALGAGPDWSQRYTTAELDMMYAAWSTDTPLASHDVHWAKATLELCLAIEESARARHEVFLGHQVPFAHASA